MKQSGAVLTALVDKALAMDASASQVARWCDMSRERAVAVMSPLIRSGLVVRRYRYVIDEDTCRTRRVPRYSATPAGVRAVRKWQEEKGKTR